MKIKAKLFEFDKPNSNCVVHAKEEWEKADIKLSKAVIHIKDDGLWLEGELDIDRQEIGILPTKHNYLVLQSLSATDLLWQDALADTEGCWEDGGEE